LSARSRPLGFGGPTSETSTTRIVDFTADFGLSVRARTSLSWPSAFAAEVSRARLLVGRTPDESAPNRCRLLSNADGRKHRSIAIAAIRHRCVPFTSMNATARRIGFLGFDGVQALDIVGPADAFGSDVFDSGDLGETVGERPYEIVVIGLTAKRFTTSAGLVMHADAAASSTIRLDSLVIPGGTGLRRPGVSEKAAAWISSIEGSVRRIASVCTGLYGLAPTGLLDGRRVTTHWSASRDIARRYPRLEVAPDAIFIKDDRFYTSAGVTAGIDLALALIEEDLGSQVALAVARELVVYFKRPGGQQQFSEPLRFQFEASDNFGDLAAWIQNHLSADLSVESLANRVNLSHRHFARAFKKEFGTTPAAFVEELRMGLASERLCARRVTVTSVARSVGYSSEDVFARAFERRFGVSPTVYRSRFSPT
jgi:transcriptional regulator GlxA family with amidase domain